MIIFFCNIIDISKFWSVFRSDDVRCRIVITCCIIRDFITMLRVQRGSVYSCAGISSFGDGWQMDCKLRMSYEQHRVYLGGSQIMQIKQRRIVQTGSRRRPQCPDKCIPRSIVIYFLQILPNVNLILRYMSLLNHLFTNSWIFVSSLM